MTEMMASTERRLVGVGVGPGDAELVTVKAVRILADADVILVPATDSTTGPGRAEVIIRTACPEASDRIRRVPFSMTERQGVGPQRRQAWDTSAEAVEQAFTDGARLVAFATIGDPSVYSTFSYLADQVQQRVPEVSVEVIPGITAMQALAATSRTPLVEGQEILVLAPATAPPEILKNVLISVDSVVLYKVGSRLEQLAPLLKNRQQTPQVIIGVNIGLPDEQMIRFEDAQSDELPYFSMLLATPHRTTTGGRL